MILKYNNAHFKSYVFSLDGAKYQSFLGDREKSNSSQKRPLITREDSTA